MIWNKVQEEEEEEDIIAFLLIEKEKTKLGQACTIVVGEKE